MSEMLDCADMPTADAVAAAVVAAAQVLGEDPLAVFTPGLRTKMPALEALRIIYPGVPAQALGRMVGAELNPLQRLKQAKGGSWWPELGSAAVEAALEALESL